MSARFPMRLPAALIAALIAALLLAACAAPRAAPVDPVQPVPPGITPLTVEQDAQLGG